MMRLLWWRKPKNTDEKLAEAEQAEAEAAERLVEARSVAADLRETRRRNHFTDAVAASFRPRNP